MKTIKFRIYDKQQNKMIKSGATPMMLKSFFEYTAVLNTRDEMPYQQFTGLSDKNGKEIYEGDILSYFTKVKENGKVQFNSDKGQFEVFWKSGDINSFDKHWTENELEIIGNIYENKSEIS